LAKKGEIVLIGIKKNFRGKGLGSALIGEAMQWFTKEKITLVTVRTQLKNMKALNFYLNLGFLPKEYDIILGKIL
jgi:GNAT superfamily N-acetyltransferase